ncbi:MAG TPA: hypothetical protein VFK90_09730 [Anaeromyxobacter sp.]|nr:hypothetical protein [Anaeromyxobacter sp.]
MGSTYYLFQRAERVEWLSARVYGALKERFRDDPEAHALFVRLEAEEEQHAKRVRLLAAHYFRDRTLTVEADPRELDLCIAECDRALLEVESGAWGTDVDEVKRRCLALEERLVRAHADLLTRHADSPLRDFLAQLAYMDMAHVQLLAES